MIQDRHRIRYEFIDVVEAPDQRRFFNCPNSLNFEIRKQDIQKIRQMKNIAEIRKEYSREVLDESHAHADPFRQFDQWWHEALASEIDEVNAMTLATTGTNGKPSARIVLLKGYSNEGFVFFTNYQSRKGEQMTANPYASLVFFWKELERQVRIEGRVEKVSASDSDAYFLSRPVESQIGAWSSPQSRVIPSREIIEENVKNMTARFSAEELVRPPHWGGFRIVPDRFEFWQGRESRLHDRICYERINGEWLISRLSP